MAATKRELGDGGAQATAPAAAQLGQSTGGAFRPVPPGAVPPGAVPSRATAARSEAAVGVSSSGSTGSGGAWGHCPAPPREPRAGRRETVALPHTCAGGRGTLCNIFIYPRSPTPTHTALPLCRLLPAHTPDLGLGTHLCESVLHMLLQIYRRARCM